MNHNNENVELQRAQLKIFILEKELKIIQDNMGIIRRDNDRLFEENNKLKGSRIYKLTRKIKGLSAKVKMK